MSTAIRPYDPTADRATLFQLWEAAYGDTWPLYQEGFYATIDPQAEHHLVAVSDGNLLGALAASRDSQEIGSIFAIVVRPEHRGQGIENALLATATQHLRRLGVSTLRFGCGQSYFWPGVPPDQPHILQLLEQHGWQAGGQITDVIGDGAMSRVPREIIDRIARTGAHLRLAAPADGPAILRFEAQHFPQWRSIAASRIAHRDFATILLAELDGEIVGTDFLTPPGDPHFRWARILGKGCAEFGALGVSEAVRGRYIGYALAVKAAEILKEHGAETIFLGWVFSTDWYGRLGYRAWMTYRQIEKDLAVQ
jgi:N-acetylglutamate synthase-like GNAT family acetyltransferase